MTFDQNLDQEFKKLGFQNYSEFIATASDLNDRALHGKCYIMDDIYSDPDDIGFIFIVKENEVTQRWQIESISAAYQLKTKRNIEGVLVIDKKVYPSKGEFIKKEQIKKEILEKVKIEKIRERFYYSKGKNDSRSKGLKR